MACCYNQPLIFFCNTFLMQPKKWPGDAGKTKMLGSVEVDKDSLSVEANGAVDELNSFVGFAASKTKDAYRIDLLKDIQGDLFTIGAELAGVLCLGSGKANKRI